MALIIKMSSTPEQLEVGFILLEIHESDVRFANRKAYSDSGLVLFFIPPFVSIPLLQQEKVYIAKLDIILVAVSA